MKSKKYSAILRGAVFTALLLSFITACTQPTQVTPTVIPATVAPTLALTPAPTPRPVMPVGTNGMPWWNDTVYYEVFVRSFYDANGDGKGDFAGLTAKLDYLNDGNPATDTDLGVTGLWLMPINPSPSYHGYDVTDYYGVNPQYGTMDEFKTFLKEAHKRGIRVNIDFVMNHTSASHPWFKAAKEDVNAKTRNWYIWAENDPGYLGPWGAKAWIPTSNGYYYAVFWDQMPDLNYQNPEVTAEMQKVAAFWLKDVGVDGFRIDGAKHLIEEGKKQENTTATLEWFKGFRSFYKSVNPQAMAVGEAWSTTFEITKYVKEKALDLVFDFDLANAWMKGVNASDGRKLISATSFDNALFPDGQYATFLTNHDQPRVMTELMGSVEKAKAAAIILLTSPGVPFIYYGEEIGMTGNKPDEYIRTPMQWTGEEKAGFTTASSWVRINSDYIEKNVAAQDKDSNSLLWHYRKLINLRNKTDALRIGELGKVESASGSVFASLRYTDQEAVLTIVNLSGEAQKEYGLTLKDAELKAKYQFSAVLYGAGKPSDLTFDASGGFENYLPLPELPANAHLILSFKARP